MNFIIEVSADCLFFLVRPWRILWKAEKEKVVVDEIKRIEKELAKCQDYEIPELGIKIGYNPIWCMMDGKEKYVSTYLIFCSLMGFFFLNNLPVNRGMSILQKQLRSDTSKIFLASIFLILYLVVSGELRFQIFDE